MKNPDDDDFVLEARIHPDSKPVESIVVGDARYRLGRRLGIFAMALAIVFFAIGAYIQSAQNAAMLERQSRLLERAAEDRSILIVNLDDLTSSNKQQTRYILQLQRAIRTQNAILRKAGLKTVQIPSFSDDARARNTSDPSERREPTPTPRQPRDPKDGAPGDPGPPGPPGPPGEPEPPLPTPIDDLRNDVCDITGICP